MTCQGCPFGAKRGIAARTRRGVERGRKSAATLAEVPAQAPPRKPFGALVQEGVRGARNLLQQPRLDPSTLRSSLVMFVSAYRSRQARPRSVLVVSIGCALLLLC